MSCLYMASGDMGADLPDALEQVLSPSLPSSPSFFGDQLRFIRVVVYRNLFTFLPVATQTEENVSPQITSVYWDAF